jgi:hypothetical protein
MIAVGLSNYLSTPTKPTALAELAFYPVTPERWQDLQTLFGEHGAYGNCWW